MIATVADLNAIVEDGGHASVQVPDGVMLRPTPSLDDSSPPLTVIPIGGKFAPTGKYQLGFVQGSYQGLTGWAFAEFLDLPNEIASGSNSTVQDGDGLNLRITPSLSSGVGIMTTMPGGATFRLTGESRLGFIEGDFQGQRGWAFAEFLSEGGATTPGANGYLPLTAIWGSANPSWDWVTPPMTQRHGRTSFSDANRWLYGYTESYCRDWCPNPNTTGDPNGPNGMCWWGHPGYDVGVGFGTPLYTPAPARVVIAGNDPYFQCVPGSGASPSGRFEMELANGDRLLFGHMAHIAVNVGDQLNPGDYVGLSGRDNGDHVHIEYRQIASNCNAPMGMRILDPSSVFA
jgi:murein DD-endopeptidase MepM/ murein hydrolase activator NlpD